MMLNQRLMRLSVLALLFVSFFSSCEDELDLITPIIEEAIENGDGHIIGQDFPGDDFSGSCEDFCFEIAFPVTVTMPDGSTETAEDEAALDAIFENYFTENQEDTLAFPIIDFPLNLTLEDGTTTTVYNADELEEVIIACFEDDNFEDCFEFNFPITILFPDETTTEVNSHNEGEQAFDNWFEHNPDSEEEPEVVYPITVTLTDSTVQTINNEDELDAIYEDCYGEEGYGTCFSFDFPVNINLPDGTTTAVNSEEEGSEVYETWFENNPDSEEEPQIVFPVTITFSDGTQQSLANEEGLELALAECDDDFEGENPIDLVVINEDNIRIKAPTSTQKALWRPKTKSLFKKVIQRENR